MDKLKSKGKKIRTTKYKPMDFFLHKEKEWLEKQKEEKKVQEVEEKFDLEEDDLLQKEYICTTTPNTVIQEREIAWIDEGYDEEDDEDFAWLSDVLYPDQAKNVVKPVD